MLDQHAGWWRRLGGWLALWKRVQELCQVEPAVAAQDRVHPGRVQLELGEGPCSTQYARELEIDEEPIKREKRPPVGLLHAKALELQLEQEGIEPDLADLRPPLELLLHVPRCVVGDEPGHEEEARERVRHEEGHHHGGGDEERNSGDDPPEPAGPGAIGQWRHASIVRAAEAPFNCPDTGPERDA